ncbi:MAG: LCP family protein [Chloroflexota bacterium]|nr:LCP family protein [Chloroflexota bacterium]
MTSRVTSAVRHSAVLAAVLSFVWPGLGQGWAGAWRRALLFAIPIAVLVVVGLLVVSTQGRARSLGLLLQPHVILGLLALNVGILAYRLVAILDAYHTSRVRWPLADSRLQRGVAGTLLGVVLISTLGMHAGIGYLGFKTYDTITTVFGMTDSPTPDPTSASLAPGATPTPIPTPGPTPPPNWAADGRLNLLLGGGDAGPGRWSLRTDSMELLSVDIATGGAALFGIPRNLVNVPLPAGPASAFACGCFPDLLNSLYTYAIAHPESFPGSDGARGYIALQEAVQEMTGLHIDGQLVVTLNGFVRLVDAIGGLDIYVPSSVYDTAYPAPEGTGDITIWIPAGQHHFDGHMALAYARSRHQDNDYNRMQRQQLVLLALGREINPCSMIVRIPELLDIARDSLWTDVPIDQVPDLLALASRVDTHPLKQYQFWPPEIPESLDAAGIAKIREMVADPFTTTPAGTPHPSSAGTPIPTPSSGC